MTKRCLCNVLLLILCHAPEARPDFAGPSVARQAVSSDGNLLVRINTPKAAARPNELPRHEVCYYQFDAAKDAYLRQSSFPLTGYLSELMYVSDSGDLVLIGLGEPDAIRIYSKEGKLTKSFHLDKFLSRAEIKACAKTGSTLQWFEDGDFDERVFFFRGPSRTIRALRPPFTVMRDVDEKVSFSGSIDLATGTLTKDSAQ